MKTGAAEAGAEIPPLESGHLTDAGDVAAPQRLVVGLEDDPLRAAVEALFDVRREAADGDVFPVRGENVLAI